MGFRIVVLAFVNGYNVNTPKIMGVNMGSTE